MLIEAQVAALHSGFLLEKEELERAIAREILLQEGCAADARTLARSRRADDLPTLAKTLRDSGKEGGL